ncbi:MAG: hypothetical protein MUF18_10485 [Fimbriiglobus sp.]|jgi:hypothetical protein|nr:hypothetical protein [Fimbriiglobus sp.]
MPRRSYNIPEMTITYYKIRGRGISLREYRRLCPDPLSFLVAVLARPFGGIAPAWSVPVLDHIPEVELDELPKAAARALDRHAGRFEDEGYRVLFHYELPLLERERVTAGTVLLSNDSWSMAQVLYLKNVEETQVGLTVGCWCEDSTYATVTGRRLELDPPPGNRIERYIGASAGELVDHFLQHAAEWDRKEGMRAIKLDDPTVRRLLVEVEQQAAQFYVNRGVLVRMTAQELARQGIEAD